MVTDIISVVPAHHALVSHWVGAPDLLALVKAYDLARQMRAGPVTGTIEQRRVVQNTRIMHDGGKRTRWRVRAISRRIRQQWMDGRVLCKAIAQLLKIQHAAKLVHAFAGTLDRRH